MAPIWHLVLLGDAEACQKHVATATTIQHLDRREIMRGLAASTENNMWMCKHYINKNGELQSWLTERSSKKIWRASI